MVSPQVLLGVAVGSVLALLGGYLVWMDARLDALEAQAPEEPDEPDEPSPSERVG